MTRDPVVAALCTRANKRGTVYFFNRHRVMFVMGDARRFTLREARAEARRLLAIVEEGGDPRPYTRREWCDLCKKPWGTNVGQGSRGGCTECRTMKCEECGNAYEKTWSAGKRFCSRSCMVASKDLGEAECAQCGAIFRCRAAGQDANKYCSRACAYKDQAAWHNPEREPRVKRKCERCGEVYFRIRSDATYENKYCGLACEGFAQEKECTQCGAEFTAVRYGQLRCSDKCALEDSRDRAAARYDRKTAGKTRRGYCMPPPEPRICVGCWETYLGTRNQKYCSSPCNARAAGKPTVLVAGSVSVARHFLQPDA